MCVRGSDKSQKLGKFFGKEFSLFRTRDAGEEFIRIYLYSRRCSIYYSRLASPYFVGDEKKRRLPLARGARGRNGDEGKKEKFMRII